LGICSKSFAISTIPLVADSNGNIYSYGRGNIIELQKGSTSWQNLQTLPQPIAMATSNNILFSGVNGKYGLTRGVIYKTISGITKQLDLPNWLDSKFTIRSMIGNDSGFIYVSGVSGSMDGGAVYVIAYSLNDNTWLPILGPNDNLFSYSQYNGLPLQLDTSNNLYQRLNSSIFIRNNKSGQWSNLTTDSDAINPSIWNMLLVNNNLLTLSSITLSGADDLPPQSAYSKLIKAPYNQAWNMFVQSIGVWNIPINLGVDSQNNLYVTTDDTPGSGFGYYCTLHQYLENGKEIQFHLPSDNSYYYNICDQLLINNNVVYQSISNGESELYRRIYKHDLNSTTDSWDLIYN
jgi:hypothetical protein